MKATEEEERCRQLMYTIGAGTARIRDLEEREKEGTKNRTGICTCEEDYISQNKIYKERAFRRAFTISWNSISTTTKERKDLQSDWGIL